MIKVKFDDLFLFRHKSKLKAGEGLSIGRFPFYTSSPTLSKWVDEELYFGESLIIGTGGSSNIHYSDGSFSTSTDCLVAVARKQTSFSVKFIYYYLYSNIYILDRGFKGAGIKHISKSYIQNIDFLLPDLETQEKIVTILDRAKNLIDKRKKAIVLLDELLKSQFVDIFGDSLLNQKGWEKLKIDDVCLNIIDCPHSTPRYVDEVTDFPCVRTSEIKNGEISWSSMKYIDEESYVNRTSRLVPEHEDIIFAREGSVGDAAIVPFGVRISLGQRVMLFRVNTNFVTSSFFWSFLRSDGCQNLIKSKTIGATVQRINMKDIKEILCIIPPMEIQNHFDNLSSSIKKNKNIQILAKAELENLISSLFDLAFHGNLKFNTSVDLEILMEGDYKFFKQNSTDEIIELLIKKLNKDNSNKDKFHERHLYDKAKKFIFELLVEGRVKQVYDEEFNAVKLVL